MKKPLLIGSSISNDFRERENDISISLDVVDTVPNNHYNIHLQMEPSSIVNNTQSVIANSNTYDLILAWNEEILSSCKNSVLFPFGTSWIDYKNYKFVDKQRKTSFLTSRKSQTDGHRLRLKIYEGIRQLNNPNISTWLTPPRIHSKDDIFRDFQFSIIVENGRHTNYFTEKIIDCMITKTVPIYCGCPNISEFFNTAGIIQFQNFDELKVILDNLPDYGSLAQHIKENYNESIKYANIWNRVDAIIDKRLV